MFLNRVRELKYLESRYNRPGAEIAVIYGRRRVGKSSLVYEWSKDKRRIFFFAQRLDSETLLRQFSEELATITLDGETTYFSDWEDAFRALAKLAQNERLVVVIDEYPYLVEMVPGISTILQKVWDLALQHTKLYLILTGSLLSVMRRHLLEADAPLYRRHTWPYELKPLQVHDLPHFFPNRSVTEIVDTYAVLGGMPHYLISVSRSATLLQNIEQDLLSPAGSLFDEPRLQLHEELRGDIENYLRVLGAIARGAHQRSEIATQSGLSEISRVDWYLSSLVELDILEHRQPLSRTAKPQQWGSYHIRDPFFRFWHRWVLPRRSYLEIDQGREALLDQIRQNMSYIVAPVWEEIARRHILKASIDGEIPWQVEEVGSWWSRNVQIDIVAVNRAERRVVIGEAKWQRETISKVDIDRLMNRGLRWLDGDSYWDVHYAFFAREFGTIPDDLASDPRIHLFTPEDIINSSLA